jgi:hypothetical protein
VRILADGFDRRDQVLVEDRPEAADHPVPQHVESRGQSARDPHHLVEETREEDRVSRLVDELGG